MTYYISKLAAVDEVNYCGIITYNVDITGVPFSTDIALAAVLKQTANDILDQVQFYSLTFKTTKSLKTTDMIHIEFPADLEVAYDTCYYVKGMGSDITCTSNSTTRIIKI